MQLAGKVAVVTGGGRGIGRAIAQGLARAGCDVCVMARSTEQIESVADEIRALDRRGLAIACDVVDCRAVDEAFERVGNQLGRIEILINNAGGGEERTVVGEDDPEAWARVVQVNLLGTYHCARAVLAHLKRSGGGTIINVGSGMGHQARSGNSSYTASKAAVWMFTRCLATEVWPDNIAVNELIPGPVETELTAGIFQAGAPHPAIPGEWVKRPDDVVELALFLAGQPSTGPTGQSFSLARRPL